jgi:general secretion pathway protein H
MAPTRPSRTGSRPRRSEVGFTLTELLVVLAIIGLLVAAVPMILQTALPGTRSLAAARTLAADLRTARGTAIAGGGATTVRFDAVRQLYLVEPGEHSHALANGVPFALPQARTTAQIAFYADGSSNGGTVFVGDTGHRHRVSIDWLSGRIAIDE